MMHSEIQKEVNDLQERIDRIKGWNDTAMIAQKVVDDLDPELKPVLSIGHDFSSLQGVLIHIYPKDMKQVAPVLKVLADCGFHQMPNSKPSDYAEIKRRTWQLVGDDKAGAKIHLSAFFYTDGSKCKFVKVGEETKPVMKLVCE